MTIGKEYRERRAARRQEQAKQYVEHVKKQDQINAEAEAAGAGGIRITDQREQAPRTLVGGTKRAGGAPENKALAGPGENKADELEGVAFASPAARAAADEAGLTAEAFKRKRKSSDSGFTKADVERIAENTAAEED